jgi:hypothetical protein
MGSVSGGGGINAGIWANTNLNFNLLCAGTSADVCLSRISTNVWGFNSGTSLQLNGGSTNNVAVFAINGNLRLGSAVGAAKATTDTSGWPMMPSVAGTPTGVPQNESVNSASFTWDRTNTRLWIRNQPTNTWNGVLMGCASGCTVNAAGQITVTASSGVTSLAGTANQITASAATGAVTLSLPSTLVAPGTFAATTSTSTPILIGTGSVPVFSAFTSVVGTGAAVTTALGGTQVGIDFTLSMGTSPTAPAQTTGSVAFMVTFATSYPNLPTCILQERQFYPAFKWWAQPVAIGNLNQVNILVASSDGTSTLPASPFSLGFTLICVGR